MRGEGGTTGKISRKKCCFRHDFEVLKMGANIAENRGKNISKDITGEGGVGGFLPP